MAKEQEKPKPETKKPLSPSPTDPMQPHEQSNGSPA